ncbi:hypothetical protein P4O66_018436, partial [Electrophorus voltai]
YVNTKRACDLFNTFPFVPVHGAESVSLFPVCPYLSCSVYLLSHPFFEAAWNGTPERMRVTTAMSESSSVRSEKLRSLARDISELGQDAANTRHDTLDSAEESGKPVPCTTGGLCFADGHRRVDYVLVYHYKRRHFIVSNGNLPSPSSTTLHKNTQAEVTEVELQAGLDSGPWEEEKALIREEFERGLLEEGLEIERDDEVRTMRFTRLHAPWSVLSREAELLKIKVPTKKAYELKERTGLAGAVSSIWAKISQLFQPGVPGPKQPQAWVLSLPFSREKLHLFDIKSKNSLFDNATRGRIVSGCDPETDSLYTDMSDYGSALSNTKLVMCIGEDHCVYVLGIMSLLAKGVYDSAFPLHDVSWSGLFTSGDFSSSDEKLHRNDRQRLHEEWANYRVFLKYQPLELISQEMCDGHLNFTMCPLCDRVCDYWQLNSTCGTARASYFFDNHATVAFAIFMSLWAAVFLEHWKRRQRCLQHSWDLTGLEEEEVSVLLDTTQQLLQPGQCQPDELRPAYEDFLLKKHQKKCKHKKKEEMDGRTDDIGGEKLLSAKGGQPMLASESLTWKDRLPGYCINMSSILLMVGVTFSAASGVILYRIIVFVVMSTNPDPEAKANVRVTVTTTAVIINLLVVLVLDEIYGAVAAWITELEIPKTEAAFEEHLILKAFLLKSMNAFAPVFYVAFFKGRFAGRPGDYVYVFGDFRMEECAPGGCLIEVCIQLGIIMLGKQLIQNNVFEIAVPKLKKMYRSYKEEKEGGEKKNKDLNRPRHRWVLDYELEPFEGLSPEYMEMIIQYGFVTLFVASFPLAPLFALLNNVIEIRLDAAKFVTEIRRPDAVRAKQIGIWYNILSGISKFAVITNAFVISFTSEFIPRMVYQYMYSETGTMHGYIDHTLAYFNTTNFKQGTAPNSTRFDRELRVCRYKDYRDPPWSPESYQLSKQYWSVLAARLAFVIFFQNLAMLLSMLVAWLIPDVPQSLKERLKLEKVLLLELLLSEEAAKQHRVSQCPADFSITIKSPWEEEEEEEEEEEKEEEEEEEEKEEVTGAQSQMTERLNEPGESKLQLPVEKPVAITTELPSPDADSPNEMPSSPQWPIKPNIPSAQLNQSIPHLPVNPEPYGSCYREFDLDGPPPWEPRSKFKSRCRTLPSRQRATEPEDRAGRASHSTSYVYLSYKDTLLPSKFLRNMSRLPSEPSSKTELSASHSCSSSNTELSVCQQAALQHLLSKEEIASSQTSVARSPFKPEFTVSQSTALPRPQSRLELTGSQSTTLPRPPSKPELMGSVAKGLSIQNTTIRAKARCQTLPPRQTGPDAGGRSPSASHSTSFPHLSQKIPLSPSELTRNTPV